MPGQYVERNTSGCDNTSGATVHAGQCVKVPVVAEKIRVEKRSVETGKVVVLVEPAMEEQLVDVPLTEETVDVRRVPVNRFIDGPVPVREEGDVTVVPVYEEVLVVEKRLMLKEEVHIHRRRVERRERQVIPTLTEQVHVLRSDASPGSSTAQAAADGMGVAKQPTPAEGGVDPVRGMEP
jgi:uncharacterized protein (TIGR02271 family)